MCAVFSMAPTKHMDQPGKQYGTHFETVQAPEAFQIVTFKKAIVPPMCGHPFQLFLSGLCPLNTRPVCASCVGVCAREQRLQHKAYPMACKKTESGRRERSIAPPGPPCSMLAMRHAVSGFAREEKRPFPFNTPSLLNGVEV